MMVIWLSWYFVSLVHFKLYGLLDMSKEGIPSASFPTKRERERECVALTRTYHYS